eukprot:GHVS01036129.1.p1 GENE.GHVS01036129.1~~GHVS01036129.1.p1  ORF type:complete len:1274 (-),score=224.85 GHVS01036129.1:311-4132(-)
MALTPIYLLLVNVSLLVALLIYSPYAFIQALPNNLQSLDVADGDATVQTLALPVATTTSSSDSLSPLLSAGAPIAELLGTSPSTSVSLSVEFTPVAAVPGTWLITASTQGLEELKIGSNGFVRLSIDGRPISTLHCPHYHLATPGQHWRADVVTASGASYDPNHRIYAHGLLAPPLLLRPKSPAAATTAHISLPQPDITEALLRSIQLSVKAPSLSLSGHAIGGVGAITLQLDRQLPLALPVVDTTTGRLEAMGGGLYGELMVWDSGEPVWGPQRVFCEVIEVFLRHRRTQKASREKLRRRLESVGTFAQLTTAGTADIDARKRTVLGEADIDVVTTNGGDTTTGETRNADVAGEDVHAMMEKSKEELADMMAKKAEEFAAILTATDGRADLADMVNKSKDEIKDIVKEKMEEFREHQTNNLNKGQIVGGVLGGTNKSGTPTVREIVVKVRWYRGDALIVDSGGAAIVASKTVNLDEHVEVVPNGRWASEKIKKRIAAAGLWVGHNNTTMTGGGVGISGKLKRRSTNTEKGEKMRSALAYKEFKSLLDKQNISRLAVMKSDLSCGDPKQGFAIPRGMDQFTSRLTDRMSSNSILKPPLESTLPPLSPSIALLEADSPVIRWSTLASNLGVRLEQDQGISTEGSGGIYRGADLRYLMPKFDVDVRQDGAHFDVFLFAPEPPTVSSDGILKRGEDSDANPDGRPNVGGKLLGGRGKDKGVFGKRGIRVDGQKLFRMTGGGGLKGRSKVLLSDNIKAKKENPIIALLPSDQSSEDLQEHNPAGTLVHRPFLSSSSSKSPPPLLQFPPPTYAADDDSRLGPPAARLLQETGRLMRDSLVGELLIKDANTGVVVYGPVQMNCPYVAVPVEEVERQRVSPLMFEVKLKTLEHGVIGDELQQPLVVKRWVFRNKSKKIIGQVDGEGQTGVSDFEDPTLADDGSGDGKPEGLIGDKLTDKFSQSSLRENTCPDMMLGLRALDVDFDFFQKTSEMQSFVRGKLAESLKVEPEQINICHATEGSTILAFDAGEGLSNRWTEVLNNPSSPLHEIFQLDPVYPPSISKSHLQAAAPTTPTSNSPDPSVGSQTHPDFSFDPLPFPVEESILLSSTIDDSSRWKDEVFPMPHQIGKGVPPPPKLQNQKGGSHMPVWLWGLVAVAAMVFIFGLVAMTVLMVAARKKADQRNTAAGPVTVEVGFSPAKAHLAAGGGSGHSAWGSVDLGVVGVVDGRPVKVGENTLEDYTNLQKWNGVSKSAPAGEVLKRQEKQTTVYFDESPASTGGCP